MYSNVNRDFSAMPWEDLRHEGDEGLCHELHELGRIAAGPFMTRHPPPVTLSRTKPADRQQGSNERSEDGNCAHHPARLHQHPVVHLVKALV